MEEPENTPAPGDDTPAAPPQQDDTAASQADTAAPEDEAAGAPAQDADEMIDVIVMGPVLGAKMSSVIAVTPQVYNDYKGFLRRIG